MRGESLSQESMISRIDKAFYAGFISFTAGVTIFAVLLNKFPSLNDSIPPVLASVPLVGPLVIGVVVGFAVWKRSLRLERSETGKCVVCEYDLTGNESGVCPECGTEIESP